MHIAITPGRYRLLTSVEVRSFSSGEVLNPESYNYITLRPQRGGLYGEDIFGLAGFAPRSPDLDERSARWGHLELAAACEHPLLAGSVEAIAVTPPVYRRFRRLSVEASRKWAFARRAELQELDRRGELSEPVDKLLAEEGCADPDQIEEETFTEPPLNVQYRRVRNQSYRLTRLRELKAPVAIVRDDEDRLRRCVTAYFQAAEEWGRMASADLPEQVCLRALGIAAREVDLARSPES
jgi:DNA-directed RNA polymerase beta' subunit